MIVVKAAARQRRGSTLADFHVLNRKQLQRVTFAESVQVIRLELHENHCITHTMKIDSQGDLPAGSPIHKISCSPHVTGHSAYIRVALQEHPQTASQEVSLSWIQALYMMRSVLFSL